MSLAELARPKAHKVLGIDASTNSFVVAPVTVTSEEITSIKGGTF